ILNDVAGIDLFLAEDVDQDGDVDLIFSPTSELGVFWMENNGDATFTNTHDMIPFSTTNPNMVLKDFDGDEIPDILYIQGSSQFYVIKGQGNGDFGQSQPFGSNDIGTFLDQTIFDVDEDGHPDIIGIFETSEDERQIGW